MSIFQLVNFTLIAPTSLEKYSIIDPGRSKNIILYHFRCNWSIKMRFLPPPPPRHFHLCSILSILIDSLCLDALLSAVIETNVRIARFGRFFCWVFVDALHSFIILLYRRYILPQVIRRNGFCSFFLS